MPVCSRSIRRRDRSAGAPPSLQEQRSAASLDQSPKCLLPRQLQHQTGPLCGCRCKSKSLGAATEVALSGPYWKPGNPLLKCTRSPKNVMMALLSRAAFRSWHGNLRVTKLSAQEILCPGVRGHETTGKQSISWESQMCYWKMGS